MTVLHGVVQVMSVSQQRACAVVDAGLKAVSLDSGPPQLLEQPNVLAGLCAPPGSCSSSTLPHMSFEGVAYENGGMMTALGVHGCTLSSETCLTFHSTWIVSFRQMS